MFDEKYMKSHKKKINSLEDALMVLVCSPFCGGVNCNQCARRMYCGDDCDRPRQEAKEFMLSHSDELLSLFGCSFKQTGAGHNLENQQAVYEALFEKRILQNLGKATESKPEPTTSCSGKCATCALSEPHSSGIRFCKSFGNFVHDDGYCYRFRDSV